MTSRPMLPFPVKLPFLTISFLKYLFDIIYEDSQNVNECSYTLFIYTCFEYMKLYCTFTWIYI